MATSSEAFKSFKSTGVLVFAHSKKDSNSLPKGVKSIRSEGGKTIPMIFVTSSDGANGLKAIDYKTLKADMRDAVRELKKSLSDLPEEEITPPAKPAEKEEEKAEKAAPELLAERQEWSNKEGVIITAAIKSADDEKVTFLMDNKKLVPYPLTKLSKESQEKVSGLLKEVE